ncbi:MAG: hypothetical protein KME20_19520 [Kaiparowitsia implicata GSE-PSE-MK54-09C]|jgi:hypothetical protein|nr:hypothetical protein [Kaiparowitsia implicata GSE-PSE-MK54-09C]
MNLPLIFDIVLGAVFILLILSLLASEVQELIATVLQWRAEHLKKSIENLILGHGKLDPTTQEFVDRLYNSSLIQALNQEGRGILPGVFKGLTRGLGAVLRQLFGWRDVFVGQGTGPSYINSEVFADALLEQMDLETISQRIGELTFRQFSDDRLGQLQDVLQALRHSVGDQYLLEAEFDRLRQQLLQVQDDYRSSRIGLEQGVDLAIAQIVSFIDYCEAALKNDNFCKDIIRTRLPFLKQSVGLKQLEPTVYEVVAMILEGDRPLPPDIADLVTDIRSRMAILPVELRHNIMLLAKQAQVRSHSLREGVIQLDEEVQAWYDRSMERASGVYRRNAKGVAIILGILLATATNADTFLIVDRLSRDTVLRTTISQSADQLLTRSIETAPAPFPADGGEVVPLPSDGSLETDLTLLRDAVSNVLDEIPLPIGWTAQNLARQLPADRSWVLSIPQMLLGWVITGIAVSMGSNFWFDLLKRVVQVRNTGDAPGTRKD